MQTTVIIIVILLGIIGIVNTIESHNKSTHWRKAYYITPLNDEDIEPMYDTLLKVLCAIHVPDHFIEYLNILYNKARANRKNEDESTGGCA